jgi:16S rRNA (adenine1518-N6/adenine1519-N6)-dimethyltransferase
MAVVRPKKQLGQHFLTDTRIASRVALSLSGWGHAPNLLEIGPGTGQLTQHLRPLPYTLWLSEVDQESISYLLQNGLAQQEEFVGDFLKWEPGHEELWAVVGNFPYHISTEIVFRVIHWHASITECVGMFQREVAQRIASPPGSRVYGITSVLTQAFFECEYLFTVQEGSFHPPPKVKSGVLRLRNRWSPPACNHKLLFRVVKTAFNQRRKMLSNALVPVLPAGFADRSGIASKRAEQLSVDAFVGLTQEIQELLLENGRDASVALSLPPAKSLW